MILVVGSEGSMGKRYQAILGYMNRSFVGVDKEAPREKIKELASRSEGVIIATPTDTHLDFIRDFLPNRKPILCEKPITKNIEELLKIKDEIKASKTPFRMMFQYEVLTDPNRIGVSRYNYFRHGTDGLIWDCLQIIGLARGEIKLREDSPTWSCMINGKALNFSHMDAAYIAYVQRWLNWPSDSLERIVQIHQKTAEYSG